MNRRPKAAPTLPLPPGEGGPQGRVREETARFMLAARLSKLPGIADLSLSTNAVLLAQKAQALYTAGVCRVNVSLDTLKPERHEFREKPCEVIRFMSMTGG